MEVEFNPARLQTAFPVDSETSGMRVAFVVCSGLNY